MNSGLFFVQLAIARIAKEQAPALVSALWLVLLRKMLLTRAQGPAGVDDEPDLRSGQGERTVRRTLPLHAIWPGSRFGTSRMWTAVFGDADQQRSRTGTDTG